MEDKASSIELLFEKAERYAKTNVDLLKLKAIGTSADVVSTLTSKFIVALVVSIVLILVNIGLALWIGEETGKLFYGFFIVASFYVVLALVLHFFREKLIKTPVNDSIITQLMKEKIA